MAHRTQLILDEWQYDGIRAIAESGGVSLSSVVREAVSEYLGQRNAAADSSLDGLRGLGRDPGLTGADHDAVLYGASRNESTEKAGAEGRFTRAGPVKARRPARRA